jgi:hypothetical protein
LDAISPLLIHYRESGSGEPAKISDFLSQEQFHRLGLYSEFFRHPVEYQMAFNVRDRHSAKAALMGPRVLTAWTT